MDNLEDLAEIGALTTEDFGYFTKTVRELLSRCFIIRGVDEALYTFGIRNYGLLEPYFACMGAQLRKDESLGVLAWRGGYESRVHLGRDETCALLVFRLFYEEKRNTIRLSEYPTITIFDFLQRFKAITGRDLKKTRFLELLRRFASLKLIKVPGDTGPDALILLYPSLALVLDQEGIDEIRGFIKNEESPA